MRDGARAFLRFCLLLIPFGALILLPGFLDPTLTWRGRAAPELTKWAHVVGWALLAWAVAWLVVQNLYGSGRVPVAYVRTDRDGVVRVGTWFDHYLTLWRRLRCAGDLHMEVRTTPGSQSGGAFDHTYLVLTSRGRARRIHLRTPVDQGVARDFEWCVRNSVRSDEGR